MVKSLNKPTTDYDITNKKYVDKLLQNEYEFKTFIGYITTSGSGSRSFQIDVTVEEGYIPFGISTFETQGAVGYGYQSYTINKISSTKYRVSGWYNVSGATGIQVWVPCYRKKLNKNLLAYTTTDVLWSGSINSQTTCNLTNAIGEYDYLEFCCGAGNASSAFSMVYRYSVATILAKHGSGNFLLNLSWDASTNRYIYIDVATISATSKALRFLFGNQSSLYQIRGIRVIPEKDLGGSVVKKITLTGRNDGNGYFKINGNSFELPDGAIPVGCRIKDVTGSVSGARQIFYQDSMSNKNLWTVGFSRWDGDSSVWGNKNLTIEVAYI